MLTESDITVYHKENGVYERYVISGVHWYSQAATQRAGKGRDPVDQFTVRIPLDVHPKAIEYVKKGDIVVRGVCTEDIQSAGDLLHMEEYGVINLCVVNRYGLNPHIRIGGNT